MGSATLRGAGAGLLAFALFATHDVLIKLLGDGYSPFQIVFFSVLFSFPLATILLMRDVQEGTLIPRHPWWVGLRTAATVVVGACAFYAFSTLPLAEVYAILFAAPLLITVLAIPMLGEAVGPRRWLAVTAGLIGVVVVLRPGAGAGLDLGHAAALAAACLGAFASVVVRKIGREERPVVLLLYPLVANFLVMGAMLPVVYRPMPLPDLGLMAAMAALSLAATMLLIRAYREAPAGVVAPMQYSQIVWATVFGLVLFDEAPDGFTALGAAIIIGSGLYILFRESRMGAATKRPTLENRSRIGTPGAPRVSGFLHPREAAARHVPPEAGLRGAPGRAGRHAPPLPPGPAE